MQRIRSIRRRSSPRGITLLEVLLASALSLVLIGAVYQALDQSWRLTFAGKIEMERNQIARAVLRQIELDIRAVMFQEQTADASSSSSSSSSNSNSSTTSSGASTGFGNAVSSTSASAGGVGNSSTTTTSTTTDDTQQAWTGSLGIRGNNYEVFLDISHVSRQLEFQPDNARVHSSDLQTVAYFLTNTAAAISNGGMMSTVSPLNLQDLDGLGLVRSQGERSVLRMLNSSSSTSGSFGTSSTGTVLPGPMQLLAPEIQMLQFRYFDGLTWYPEWDSSTMAALPRAIEVTITFEPAPKRSGFLMSPAIGAGTDMYRMVIPVPVSNPMPPEESL